MKKEEEKGEGGAFKQYLMFARCYMQVISLDYSVILISLQQSLLKSPVLISYHIMEVTLGNTIYKVRRFAPANRALCTIPVTVSVFSGPPKFGKFNYQQGGYQVRRNPLAMVSGPHFFMAFFFLLLAGMAAKVGKKIENLRITKLLNPPSTLSAP